MATRSTITVRGPNANASFYRHWDGYPAWTGRHLCHVLRDAHTLEAVAVALLTAHRESPHGGDRYELTVMPDTHDDREWHYDVRVMRTGAHIRVYHRPIGGSMSVAFDGDLPACRRWCAGQLRDLLGRHRDRQRVA